MCFGADMGGHGHVTGRTSGPGGMHGCSCYLKGMTSRASEAYRNLFGCAGVCSLAKEYHDNIMDA